MVERWAICFDNVCVNICLWDGQTYDPETNPTAWQPPGGALMVNVQNIFCDIGWVWDGSQFNPPPASQDAGKDVQP
jgi:hypothetical protein